MDLSPDLSELLAKTEAVARRLFEVGLAIVIGLMLARLVWLIASPGPAVADLRDRPLPQMAMSQSESIKTDRTLLVQTNPFASDVALIVEDAPETQLNLRLIGIITSTDEAGGSARIVTANNAAQSFRPGDTIQQGVVLERILQDRVVLTRNGVNEILMQEGRSAGLSVISDGSQTSDPDSVTLTDRPSTEDSSSVTGKVSSAATLMNGIRPVPVQRDGELFGYELVARGGSNLTDIGLRNGDILTAINGRAVSEVDFSRIQSEIGNSRIADLTVDRDGTSVSVRLEFVE